LINFGCVGSDELDLNWPTQPDSHIVRVSGPILDKDDPKPKRLFFFDTINEAAAIEMDADASPGFWPRATNKPADAGVAAPPQNAVAAVSVSKRPGLATCLFVLWVLSGATLAFWLWQTGGVMRNAALNFRQAAPAECVNAADKKKKELAWAAACEAEWQKVWRKLYPDAEVAEVPAPAAKAPPPKGEEAKTLEGKTLDATAQDAKSDAKDAKAKSPRTIARIRREIGGVTDTIRPEVGGFLWNDDGHLSLLTPFVLSMASFVLLLLAAGLAKKGLWFGVLIDDRNRISMSRTQQVAWTALLIGSMAIMGWFNSSGVGLVDESARSAWNVFPYMAPALWAALGINLVATPYLSDVILNRKDPQNDAAPGNSPAPDGQHDQPPQPQPSPGLGVRQLVTPARLDTNPDPKKAGWIDLITGETKGSDQELDVSRIQHLVISGALLTTYFMALADALGDVGGESIMSAIAVNQPVFTNMPGVGTGTFLGLLGISHASYLIFKANSPEGKPSAAPPKNAPPT
jgi:hypothetical protein